MCVDYDYYNSSHTTGNCALLKNDDFSGKEETKREHIFVIMILAVVRSRLPFCIWKGGVVVVANKQTISEITILMNGAMYLR